MCTSVRSETALPPPLPAGAPKPWLSFLVIALVAIVAMAPELLIGMTVTDNYRFNLLWPEQFGELFRSGHLYPRWLPHAWKGLGTPAFYFYPPVFFWVSSMLDVATGGALPPERFVPIATLLVLMGSGLAMFAWLKPRAGDRPALIGAAAYMLAPYHLYDIYCRGALAEATAYACVPLVMLGLARLGEGRSRYLPMVSLAYAALLMSHLPTALLVSVLLIPAFVAWTALRVERPMRFLVQGLAGGLIGIAIAAIYLLPALTLLSFVNPASLTKWYYRPETWFFWNFPSGPRGGRMLFIIPVAVGAALLAGATFVSSKGWKMRNEPLLWAGVTIGVVVLIAGLLPPFWKLPGMALVQFPWRALLIVEFASITMIATTGWSVRGPLMLSGAALIAFAYVALALMARHTVERTIAGQALTASQIRWAYLDAPEYLPAGATIISRGDDPDDTEVKLPNVPLASASDPRARVSAVQFPDGGMTVAVDSPAKTKVALPRYDFPHWRLRDANGRLVPIAPDPEQRIVTFRAPAGKSQFRLALGTAPNEVLGRFASLVAVLLLIAVTLWTRRTARER